MVFIFNPELLLIGVESFWHGLAVFCISLIAILSFSAITQWWMIVRLRWYEAILLAGVVITLFRPGVVMDRILPAWQVLDFRSFIAGKTSIEAGRAVRFQVVRQTNYGDRYRLYTLEAPPEGGEPGRRRSALRWPRHRMARRPWWTRWPSSVPRARRG